MLPSTPLVAVVMGSHSDWEIMSFTCDTLKELGIPYVTQVVSAHRTPDLLFQFAEQARSNHLEVIIAGAGGSAHLPGMIAAKTSLPILGVPIPSNHLKGMDSLLSIVQMPGGIPVGTLSIGKSGAINAALLAASILANKYSAIQSELDAFRVRQTQRVLDNLDPRNAP